MRMKWLVRALTIGISAGILTLPALAEQTVANYKNLTAPGEVVSGKNKTVTTHATSRGQLDGAAGTWVTITTSRYFQNAQDVFIIGDIYTAGDYTVRKFLEGLASGAIQDSWFGAISNNATLGDNNRTDVGSERRALINKILATASPAVLNAIPPNGISFVISTSGELVATLPTTSVTRNSSIGIGYHENAVVWMVSATTGGTLNMNGQEYNVLGTQLISPIALDLNHNGKIDVTGTASGFVRYDASKAFNPDGAVTFDLAGHGTKGRFEWLKDDGDGFLVDDSKGEVTKIAQGNGELNGNHLFGGQKFDNGYVKLAHLFGSKQQIASTETNLRIKSGFGPLKGDTLKGLKVWIDKNHDAKAQPNELKTLAELGITELGSDYRIERGNDEVRMVSYFVQNGKKYLSEDVWFAEDPAKQ